MFHKAIAFAAGVTTTRPCPNTGRISLRSDRFGHEELVRWSVAEIDRLIERDANVSPFIRTFARPIDLASIPTGVDATYFAINVAALTEELFEADEPMRLVRRSNGNVAILDKAAAEALLVALDQTFAIRTIGIEMKVFDLALARSRQSSLYPTPSSRSPARKVLPVQRPATRSITRPRPRPSLWPCSGRSMRERGAHRRP